MPTEIEKITKGTKDIFKRRSEIGNSKTVSRYCDERQTGKERMGNIPILLPALIQIRKHRHDKFEMPCNVSYMRRAVSEKFPRLYWEVVEFAVSAPAQFMGNTLT